MATSLPAVEKLEAFLEIIQDQRARHLRRNPEMPANAIFSNHDIAEINKDWMNDYTSWMNTEKLRAYEQQLASTDGGARQRAHQMRRHAFSAFLFQVIGNKHVLLAAIQHPVFSAAQPDCSFQWPAAMLQSFMDAWEQ